eukprot:g10787.t1
MVDLSLGKRGKMADGSSSHGDEASQLSCDGARDRQLTKEKLDLILAEDNPHKQFALFANQLWFADAARMSTQDKTIAEYDFLNVMFCREQNFTHEQTIAFRGITLSVFEATIVRGELDLDGAFEAFTERVLSLAEVKETGPSCRSGGEGGGGGGGSNDTGSVPSPVERDSDANRTEIEGTGHTGSLPEGEGATGGGGDAGGGGGGDVGQRGGGAVFSVGDIDAITRFVARGLYRNFSLYRMCFKEEERCCREFRQVQVETPLRLNPLQEADIA